MIRVTYVDGTEAQQTDFTRPEHVLGDFEDDGAALEAIAKIQHTQERSYYQYLLDQNGQVVPGESDILTVIEPKKPWKRPRLSSNLRGNGGNS